MLIMNIEEIRYLAARFWRGIEAAHDRNLFRKPPFSDFPNTCCGDAPELLAQYLLDSRIDQNIRYRYVYGTYRYEDIEDIPDIFGHSWLVVNNTYIVDITADQRQFKNERIFL